MCKKNTLQKVQISRHFSIVKNFNQVEIISSFIPSTGVAKLHDSPNHFSKFEIFRKPQLNTYLTGMQKKVLKLQKLYLLKTYK